MALAELTSRALLIWIKHETNETKKISLESLELIIISKHKEYTDIFKKHKLLQRKSYTNDLDTTEEEQLLHMKSMLQKVRIEHQKAILMMEKHEYSIVESKLNIINLQAALTGYKYKGLPCDEEQESEADRLYSRQFQSLQSASFKLHEVKRKYEHTFMNFSRNQDCYHLMFRRSLNDNKPFLYL
jgi:hypothetical protein